MTNDQLEAIYKYARPINHVAALRCVYTAGYNAGAGISTTANTADASVTQAAPTTYPNVKHSDK